MKHIIHFADCVQQVTSRLSWEKVMELVLLLIELRGKHGRLFVLGVGGSAANASHAVNDFRKLCGMEAYAPTDNVAELTARTNDDGFETVFERYLQGCRIGPGDAVLVLSVGGGNVTRNISVNLIEACAYAKSLGAQVFGIVGKSDGYVAMYGDCVVIVPTVDDALLTPLAESFQSVILHAIVSHPSLAVAQAKWESGR